MEITFWGAVRTVTGSMHLLTVNGKRILLDCGLFQGRRKEAEKKNRNLPFDPASVDYLILSHAHIDHSGNIPRLVADGFEGTIFATAATRDLCSIMLADSAHIQQRDAEYINKRHAKKGLPPVQPLYRLEDAVAAMDRFVTVGYNRPLRVTDGVQLRFFDAGHILGSAIVLLEIEENGRSVHLGFTGDLGRKNMPILRDPWQVHALDVLITESTYGNRHHDDLLALNQKLAEVVNRTYNRGGKVIVPAFSVGRTQEIVYCLNQLWQENLIPGIPVFVDSPLSTNATEVFRMHPECFDMETSQFLHEHEDPFGFARLKYIRDLEESKKLNNFKGPCIIISASGMCEAGRILHHLKNSIESPDNTVLVVGFMAPNTLGRRLVEKEEIVRIFGDTYRLRAEVVILNAFSAHADRDELLGYIGGLNLDQLKNVFVVHGEESQSMALADGVREMAKCQVEVPEPGETAKI